MSEKFRMQAKTNLFLLMALMLLLPACSSTPVVTTTPTQSIVSPPTVNAIVPTQAPVVFKDFQVVPIPTPYAAWKRLWLDGIPCKPPCWNGITPGKTTVAEAVEILKRTPIITEVETWTEQLTLRRDIGHLEWNWITGESAGSAEYHTEATTQTVYVIYLQNVAIKFGDVIKAYGEPSHISARAILNPHGESIAYLVTIVYRDFGIALHYWENPSFSPETYIEGIGFFAPDDDESYRQALIGAAAAMDWIVPWEGFQDFQYYCKDGVDGRLCSGELPPFSPRTTPTPTR